jgi:hypothetical protein
MRLFQIILVSNLIATWRASYYTSRGSIGKKERYCDQILSAPFACPRHSLFYHKNQQDWWKLHCILKLRKFWTKWCLSLILQTRHTKCDDFDMTEQLLCMLRPSWFVHSSNNDFPSGKIVRNDTCTMHMFTVSGYDVTIRINRSVECLEGSKEEKQPTAYPKVPRIILFCWHIYFNCVVISWVVEPVWLSSRPCKQWSWSDVFYACSHQFDSHALLTWALHLAGSVQWSWSDVFDACSHQFDSHALLTWALQLAGSVQMNRKKWLSCCHNSLYKERTQQKKKKLKCSTNVFMELRPTRISNFLPRKPMKDGAI